jgi:hypothetical protein
VREAGLVGVIAVNGTKVAATVSEEQTVDYEQIAREILAEAKAIDAAEDELYGAARRDELPLELSRRPNTTAGSTDSEDADDPQCGPNGA